MRIRQFFIFIIFGIFSLLIVFYHEIFFNSRWGVTSTWLFRNGYFFLLINLILFNIWICIFLIYFNSSTIRLGLIIKKINRWFSEFIYSTRIIKLIIRRPSFIYFGVLKIWRAFFFHLLIIKGIQNFRLIKLRMVGLKRGMWSIKGSGRVISGLMCKRWIGKCIPSFVELSWLAFFIHGKSAILKWNTPVWEVSAPHLMLFS